MEWPGSSKSNGYFIYHSGYLEGPKINGNDVTGKEELCKCISNFVPLNDRIMLIQLQQPINPLKKLSNCNTKEHGVDIIVVDSNSKVGDEITKDISVQYGFYG